MILKKYIGPFVFIAISSVVLFIFFLWNEKDGLSTEKVINAEKIYYFFSIIGALVTFLLLFLAYQQLQEMKKQVKVMDKQQVDTKEQFLFARRPELFFTRTNLIIDLGNNIDDYISLKGEEVKEVKADLENNRIQVENIGLGIAKDIELNWIPNVENDIRITFKFFPPPLPLSFSIPFLKEQNPETIQPPYELLIPFAFDGEIWKRLIELKNEKFTMLEEKTLPIENDITLSVRYTDVFKSELIRKVYKLNLNWRIIQRTDDIEEYSLDLRLIEEIA